MKFYALHVFLFHDETHIVVRKDGAPGPGDNSCETFNLPNWCGDPDWGKILRLIRFFEPEYVYVSDRISQ